MDKTSEINTPEGRLAAEVIITLQKARKNLRIYPSNNPIYTRTLEDTYKKIMEFFQYADDLVLKIQRNEFMLGEEVVYNGTDAEENMALFFFRDGLRSLTFNVKMTQDELLKFLLVIAADLDSEAVEEDMVTLLWEKDFMHIKYKVDDTTLVEDEGFQREAEEKATENPTSEGVMQQAVEDAPQEDEEIASITPMPITNEDLEILSRDIESYGRDSVEKLTDILFDMLYSSANIDEFKDVARIMQNSVEHSAQSNDLKGALKIFSRVKDVITQSKSENVREALSEVLSSAGSGSLMKIIGDRLDTKEGVENEDFKGYVSVLGTGAIPKLIKLLGELQTIQGRKKAIMALTFVGKRDILALSKGLTDKRWFVVRNVVMVLRETQDKKALDYIASALGHSEPRVRREAMKGISELGGLKYIDRLVDHLLDEDQNVKIAAALALGKLRNRMGLEALIERVTDKSLLEEDPILLKKYFEAISFFKYDDVIGFLEDILRKNPFFGRAAYNDLKKYAIHCVGLIGDPRSIELLEELADSKVKMISDGAKIAIKRIARARKK